MLLCIQILLHINLYVSLFLHIHNTCIHQNEMKKLGTIIDLNKMSLLGVEIDVLQEALDQDGIDGLNRLAEAVAHRQYEYYLNHLLGIVSLYLGHI